MGTCRICNKPAGWFRSEHAACAREHEASEHEKYAAATKQAAEAFAAATKQAAEEQATTEQHWAEGVDLLTRLFIDITQGRGSLDLVESSAKGAHMASLVGPANLRKALIEAWERAARQCLNDGRLSREEDAGLGSLMKRFGLVNAELNAHGVLTKLVHCKLFNALDDGREPDVLTLSENYPVILKKNERAAWEFAPATLFEDRQGRIAQVGHEPVYGTERVELDTGIVLATTRNLYFVGSSKSLQLPYAKIASVTQLRDGVSIGRTAVTAKPLIFRTGDGAFTHRLLSALVRAANK